MPSPISIPVEICINCTNPDSTFAAVTAARKGGAQRVELCRRMDLGGLTPAPNLVKVARDAWGDEFGLQAMIRPRPGDFAYSLAETDIMAAQIREVTLAGADGVVLGAVRDGQIDVDVWDQLLIPLIHHKVDVTCHRAFDAVAYPVDALFILDDFQVDRILTSGTPWGSGLGVADGADRLSDLRRWANPRFEIVLGGGVNAATIGPILAQLPLDAGPVSIHAYSSVLRKGVTDEGAVAELVAVANRAARDWMDHNP